MIRFNIGLSDETFKGDGFKCPDCADGPTYATAAAYYYHLKRSHRGSTESLRGTKIHELFRQENNAARKGKREDVAVIKKEKAPPPQLEAAEPAPSEDRAPPPGPQERDFLRRGEDDTHVVCACGATMHVTSVKRHFTEKKGAHGFGLEIIKTWLSYGDGNRYGNSKDWGWPRLFRNLFQTLSLLSDSINVHSRAPAETTIMNTFPFLVGLCARCESHLISIPQDKSAAAISKKMQFWAAFSDACQPPPAGSPVPPKTSGDARAEHRDEHRKGGADGRSCEASTAEISGAAGTAQEPSSRPGVPIGATSNAASLTPTTSGDQSEVLITAIAPEMVPACDPPAPLIDPSGKLAEAILALARCAGDPSRAAPHPRSDIEVPTPNIQIDKAAKKWTRDQWDASARRHDWPLGTKNQALCKRMRVFLPDPFAACCAPARLQWSARGSRWCFGRRAAAGRRAADQIDQGRAVRTGQARRRAFVCFRRCPSKATPGTCAAAARPRTRWTSILAASTTSSLFSRSLARSIFSARWRTSTPASS